MHILLHKPGTESERNSGAPLASLPGGTDQSLCILWKAPFLVLTEMSWNELQTVITSSHPQQHLAACTPVAARMFDALCSSQHAA